MKAIHLIIVITISSLLANAQQTSDPKKVWSDIIEVEQGILQRHVLNDIPGTIIVLIPDGDEKFKSRLIGRKVLKDNSKLPKLNSKPTELVSDIAKKDLAVSLSYLSFASASMENNEEIRFSITETSNCHILDNDIDWQAFNERVASIKTKNPNLPEGTIFAVVKVASVITIDNQRFKSVKKASDISGWGFSNSNKYLTESSNRRTDFKVGVSITFSDEFLDILVSNSEKESVNKNWKENNIYFNKLQVLSEINKAFKDRVVGDTREIFDETSLEE